MVAFMLLVCRLSSQAEGDAEHWDGVASRRQSQHKTCDELDDLSVGRLPQGK